MYKFSRDQFYPISFAGLCNILGCQDDHIIKDSLQLLADEGHIRIRQFQDEGYAYYESNKDFGSFIYTGGNFELNTTASARRFYEYCNQPSIEETGGDLMKVKILFLSANPRDLERLRLDEEIRAIKEKIRSSANRDRLDIISELAVRPDDLIQALNEHKPNIVHFSGHGSGEQIFLCNDQGDIKPVTLEALASLFKNLKDNIEIIILNACYSKAQAKAISKYIPCVIGMNKAISDDAAIIFASSFYRAVGFGRSIREAFEQGTTALLLEGIPEESTPELLTQHGIDASGILLVKP